MVDGKGPWQMEPMGCDFRFVEGCLPVFHGPAKSHEVRMDLVAVVQARKPGRGSRRAGRLRPARFGHGSLQMMRARWQSTISGRGQHVSRKALNAGA
jgi:hypothetical protein